jgi:hypothetical protein
MLSLAGKVLNSSLKASDIELLLRNLVIGGSAWIYGGTKFRHFHREEADQEKPVRTGIENVGWREESVRPQETHYQH